MPVPDTSIEVRGFESLTTVPMTSHDLIRLGRLSLRQNEEGLFEGLVPLDLIHTEAVPVDARHVQELSESIRLEREKWGGTGMQSPIALAHIPGEGLLHISDGFHRAQIFKHMGAPVIRGAIRPNTTMEDLFSLRIVNSQHKSVRMPRLVAWAQQAWENGPYADLVSAQTAFSFALNKNLRGQKYGIDSDQLVEIRGWLETMGKKWMVSPGVLYSYFAIASIAAPDLFNQVRERAGRRTEPELTPRHLRAIAQALPDEINYDLQRVVAATVQENNMSVASARTLATMLQGVESLDEAQQMVDENLLRAIAEPAYTPGELRRAEQRNTQFVVESSTHTEYLHTLLDDELRIAALSLEVAVLRMRLDPEYSRALFMLATQRARPEAESYIKAALEGEEMPTPRRALELMQRAAEATSLIPPEILKGKASKDYIQRVTALLPHLESADRQALVLATFFRVSTASVAHVLSRDEESVKAMLRQVRSQLFLQTG